MEEKIIKWLKKSFCDRSIPLGTGLDDAALVSLPGDRILVSSDMLIEGTHFSPGENARNIGLKAANVSLSDMAAMGAFPLYLMVSLGIPGKYSFASVKKIFQGIKAAMSPFKVRLIGGDTVRSSSVVIDTVIIGINRKGQVLRRCGAKPGDMIFTTGYFGESFSSGWHYRFMPRIKEMEYLKQKIKITSAMDASDGLFVSLRTLSQEGSVAFQVDCSSIRSRMKRGTWRQRMDSALFDGEDFELVFTGRSSSFEKIMKDFEKRFHIPLSCIGKVCSGKGLVFHDEKKRVTSFQAKEFQHFG